MLIHEISRKLGITERAIRFYEQKGLLSPAKMKDNGYRRYTEQDAWRLQTIVSLREVGMTLADIGRTLAEADGDSQDAFIDALQLQRAMLFQQLSEMKMMIGTMDRMIQAAGLNQQVPTEQLYELAQQNKAMRDLRGSWRDHWNFDARASKFDKQLAADASPQATYEAALQRIAELATPAPGCRGLDVGTGTGNLAGMLQRLGASMAAIDQSRQMLKACAGKHPEVELKLGNVLAIPYMDGQFDLVVSSFALHHLTAAQRELAWSEMLRVLKPDGTLCLADYMLRTPDEAHTFIASLTRSGAQELPMMHDQVELYPVHSDLMAWLTAHASVVRSQPLHELVYVVCAQK
ncbi:MerR family transcriptional regulator [Paenibacillus aestuarii]|uniref:Methyltransferase domain-containing protein n=1 Tax=Paenibacillus aestuarii TaxID=516965 RepID=A0ABW0KGT7_9BACL|nr:methyltransferase domain-containing protein [Paenibacillus aestuarii]